MHLKINKVIVYNIEFSDLEKQELCIELDGLDEERFPTLTSLYKTISDVHTAFIV